MKRLALALALVLLLCGCGETPPPATTAPPETAVPVQTTLPAVIEDFSEYEALLAPGTEEPNWLFAALGCVFDNPQELDLNYLFYLGLGHGSWELVSPESEAYLIENGFWREMDLQPMPKSELDAILRANFGVGIDDVPIPGEWQYLEAEDFYCSNHNDAYFPSPIQITAVEDDGQTIRIHYHVADLFYNTKTDEYLDSADLILCLKRQPDGSIHAVSNLPDEI